MGKNIKTFISEQITKVVKEWYDDEYFEKPEYKKGMGKFEDIDWRVLFDELMENTKNNKIYAPGTMSSIFFSKNDLTDYDGMLSPEEYNQLEAFNLIETFDFYPILPKEYQNYDAFVNKAKEIWNKEGVANSDKGSEAPFLRGREPMSESMLRQVIRKQINEELKLDPDYFRGGSEEIFYEPDESDINDVINTFFDQGIYKFKLDDDKAYELMNLLDAIGAEYGSTSQLGSDITVYDPARFPNFER